MCSIKPILQVTFVLITAVLFLQCDKKPAEMVFYNIQGTDYVSDKLSEEAKKKIEKENKSFEDVFDALDTGIAKKPGVIFSAVIGRKIGVSSILLQIIDQQNGSIVDKEDLVADPDTESLSITYNFRRKGAFLVNFIAKGEIIAQGKIKYE